MLDTFSIAKIYIIRHATPDWTRTDIPYDVPPGPALVEQGEKEAAQLGSFLQAAGVQKLYHSPLERTRRTAEISAAVAGIPFVEDGLLAEWRSDESEAQLTERVFCAWDRTAQEVEHGGAVGLVTHGGPARVILEQLGVSAEVLRVHKAKYDGHNPLPPAGVWLAEKVPGSLAWHLELVFTPALPN